MNPAITVIAACIAGLLAYQLATHARCVAAAIMVLRNPGGINVVDRRAITTGTWGWLALNVACGGVVLYLLLGLVPLPFE
jgi:hypothetical protein